MLLRRIGTALVVLVALANASPEAWAGRLGPEFRVNTFTRDTQNRPSVAGLSDGGFVVTWTSELQTGPYSSDIYGQRYTHDGKKIGGEFRVNTYTRGVQYSSVAGLRPNEGGFVVTWTSHRQDGYGDAVYGQRYNATGRKLGTEFRINSFTWYDQEHSSVAKLSNGGFVVTWTSFEQDGSGTGVYGQRFNAAGARVGSEFRVTTNTLGHQHTSSVAGLSSNGGFVVTWTDSERLASYGQLYSAAGAKVGGEFRFGLGRTSVAGLRDGGFVVTRTGDDGSLSGIFGQRYDAAGRNFGDEFRINAYTRFRQLDQSIAGLGDGGFVVIWTSQDGQDGSGHGVYGQRYSHEGKKVGTEFRVNTHAAGNQGYSSSVAALTKEGFVATWDSDGQDGSRTGVYGQVYNP